MKQSLHELQPHEVMDQAAEDVIKMGDPTQDSHTLRTDDYEPYVTYDSKDGNVEFYAGIDDSRSLPSVTAKFNSDDKKIGYSVDRTDVFTTPKRYDFDDNELVVLRTERHPDGTEKETMRRANPYTHKALGRLTRIADRQNRSGR